LNNLKKFEKIAKLPFLGHPENLVLGFYLPLEISKNLFSFDTFFGSSPFFEIFYEIAEFVEDSFGFYEIISVKLTEGCSDWGI
jgi:hypothetical protein